MSESCFIETKASHAFVGVQWAIVPPLSWKAFAVLIRLGYHLLCDRVYLQRVLKYLSLREYSS